MPNSTIVRTRFAPSPTGSLHIGGARTALYNYLFAKQQGGQFIVRIEDTDQTRHDESAIHTQLSDLSWLGLSWDEGLQNDENLSSQGDHGPYRQSLRRDLYQTYADQLLQSGQAYYCFMTDEELDAAKAKAKAAGDVHQVQSPYRDQPLADAMARLARGDRATIRCKVHHDGRHDFSFNDLIRGDINLPSHMISDFVIVRSDGMPVYNFCCVIDDAQMQITHVMRGEEHLSNTLKQLILYRELGWQPPVFGHLSVILGHDGKKLSKRDGGVSVDHFRQAGCLPEALRNYIALLGWNDGSENEFYSHDELMQHFSVDGLHAASAHFDIDKLHWLNAHYLQQLSHDDLWQTIVTTLPTWAQTQGNHDQTWRNAALDLFKPEWRVIPDAAKSFAWLDDEAFSHDEEAQMVMDWPTTATVVRAWHDQLHSNILGNADAFTSDHIHTLFQEVKTTTGLKGKPLFKALRVAITGCAAGPDLKALLALLTPAQCCWRAERVLETLSDPNF